MVVHASLETSSSQQLAAPINCIVFAKKGETHISKKGSTKPKEDRARPQTWFKNCLKKIQLPALAQTSPQHRGKWEQQQPIISLDRLLVQHKCTVMGIVYGDYLQLPFSTLHGPLSLQGPPNWESCHRWAYYLGDGEVWWMALINSCEARSRAAAAAM